MFWLKVVLIVLQICLCQGGCDIFNSPPQEISRCREVEEIFEKGLISNKDNLFVLREAFLSNSRPPPNLMLVKYDIFNWTNYTEQLLWSNSRIFTTIHPNLLSAFQSGIMTIIFYFEGLVYTPEITLHIPVSDTSRLAPTSAEIARALSAINEKLPLYTNIQSTLPEQREIKRGFSLQFVSPWNEHIIITVIIVASTVLSVLTGLIFTANYIKRLSSRMRQHPSLLNNSYFWSFVSVISVINVAELLTQIILIAITQVHEHSIVSLRIGSHADPKLLLRLISFATSIIAMIIGLGCGIRWEENKLPPTQPLEQLPCPCCCTPSCLKRFQQCYAMCNIYLFVSLICINIIPTAIYVFVNPILVLSTIVSIVSLIVCFVVVLPFPDLLGIWLDSLTANSKTRKEVEKSFSVLCNLVPYILLCITLTLFMLLYLILLHKSGVTNTNDIVQAAFPFLPILIPGLLGYFSTTPRVAKGDPLSDTDCLKPEKETTFTEENDTEDETAHLLLNTKL